ncbi:hypothetical protein [Mycolicibacterium fluoranthenivorans]|uniref:Uncharacterized protein n=1 Tax=Mycolicibacterium fluoranthenivorans TaxID=258505 RepID=A0A1G4VFM8_9MYCO|nr:hypothetical protein [Mycolicibacterium fluoranthenivorans]SCX06093.1 hypothetical protein SAMN02799620_00811 [Mycolicibacterium fluoranthenivorans]
MTADEPDPAAPTELAGAAVAETRSAYAWGLADAETEVLDDERRLSPGRITAAAVAASVVLIGAAAAVAWMQLRGDQQSRQAGDPAPTSAVSASPSPRPDLLNGVYRIEYHWRDATYRDNERDGGGTMDWNAEGDGGPPFDWLTLSSTCAKDCIATGQMLTQDRKQIPGARTIALKLTNGAWEDIAPGRIKSECTADDGTVTGRSSATVAMSFTPRPDGTLSGTSTMTVETNECGDQGNTVVTPLTLTRVGNAV